MKMMKKAATLALSAAMIFSLVACGGGAEKTTTESAEPTESTQEGGAMSFEGKTLKVAGLDGGYGTEGWKAVIAAFESKTGAKVESTFEKNIADVLRPQIQAGNSPDVIYMSIGGEGGLTETMIKENMVLDITDVLDKKVPGEEVTVKEKIIPGFLDTYNTNPYGDGKTYLAPLFYTPCGLFYSKSMIPSKDTLPATFAEFTELGKAAQADGVALFTYPTTGYFDSFIPTLINEVGGPELFNKLMNYDVEAWKSDEAKAVLQTVADLAPYLHPDTVSNTNIKDGFKNNQQSVIDGTSMFIPNGFWLPDEMKETTPEGFEWGFMPLPAYKEGGDRYSFTFFEQAYVPASSAEPELAKEFVAFLYSDEAVKAFYENGGAVQPVAGVEEMISDPGQKEIYSIYASGAKAAMGGFVAAPPVEGADIKAALYDTINSVMTGDKTVDDWHKEVVSTVEKISAELNK